MSKIWAQQLDTLYDVYVKQSPDDPYKGTLCVELRGEVLLSKEVTITHGGPFGPDSSDVAFWADEVCKFVDNLPKQN